MEITKQDYQKYFKEKGELGFNPAHNKKVIEQTIRNFEKNEKKKHKDFIDKLQERTNAVSWYLCSRKAHSGYGPEKYFSRRMLAYLRGQQIINKLRVLGKPFTQRDIIKGVERQHAEKKAKRKAET